NIRTELKNELEQKGIATLQEKLKKLDPDYYSEVDLQNPHRVIRALEICIGTGKTFSSFRKDRAPKRPFKTLYLGLTAERELVYNRINRRVDQMMEEGLLEEVKGLY
ncbi:tRNA dimethylallyltransferase, partial [Longispora fulva]|uniref:tRNA dimethylallyltransferase n=2 Tax=Bacteria TaxID=2 RepID=UPI00363BABF7